jgi:hypothetical protein
MRQRESRIGAVADLMKDRQRALDQCARSRILAKDMQRLAEPQLGDSDAQCGALTWLRIRRILATLSAHVFHNHTLSSIMHTANYKLWMVDSTGIKGVG